MPQLSSFLSQANIFKNYTPGEHTSVAVKADSQIFSASLNVVKTGPIYHEQNYFKLLNIDSGAPFKVILLLLNPTETLLAVVGESNVTIVEVKDPVDFNAPEPIWNCFDVSITLPKSLHTGKPLLIKDVVWHPASSKNSELVILTETEILLYDIVFSLTQPMLVLPLNKFSQLNGKTVLSIAFGSSQNFAGSITLYLSTESGDIFAVFPFTYKTSTLSTTKSLLTKFVDDWRSCLQSYEARLPPSAVFSSYRTVFSKHSALVDKVEAKLNLPHFSEASETQNLSLCIVEDASSSSLLGPLATLGKGAKIVQANVSDNVLLLASIHKDASDKVVVSYLSQIIPLTISIEKPSESLIRPKKPVRKPKKAKDVTYVKPRRGFGFVVESDDDDEQEDDEYEKELRNYTENVHFFNEKQKINSFIDSSFNKLTILTTDATDFKYDKSIKSLFQHIYGSKILFALGTSVIIGDLSRAVKHMFSPDTVSFDVEYKLIEAGFPTTSYAYVKDTIEGAGEYLIACSSSDRTGVFQSESFKEKRPGVIMDASVKPIADHRTRHTTLPAEELSIIKAEASRALARPDAIDPTQFESLETVHQITADSMKKVGALTKFLLALQVKVEIQFEDLKLQTRDLLSVKEKVGAKEVYEKNHARIEKLIDRQEKLIAREENLRRTIVERFEKVRAAQKLPLSQAEKDWFKELNSITKTVAFGGEKTPSLSARLETLKAEVHGLTQKKDQASEEYLNEMLSSLLLRSNLSRIALVLALEGELLTRSKNSVDICLQKLQDNV